MPLVAALHGAKKSNQFVNVDLVRVCAYSTDLDRPRPRFPAAICQLFWLLFCQAPLVEIVVARDKVFGRKFHPIELVRWVERIVQAQRVGPKSRGQKRRSGNAKSENAQELP